VSDSPVRWVARVRGPENRIGVVAAVGGRYWLFSRTGREPCYPARRATDPPGAWITPDGTCWIAVAPTVSAPIAPA